MPSKEAPEGFVYDGKHLVEQGLATHHPVYAEDGTVKGVVSIPFPLRCTEVGCEGKCIHDAAWYRKQAKRR